MVRLSMLRAQVSTTAGAHGALHGYAKTRVRQQSNLPTMKKSIITRKMQQRFDIWRGETSEYMRPCQLNGVVKTTLFRSKEVKIPAAFLSVQRRNT